MKQSNSTKTIQVLWVSFQFSPSSVLNGFIKKLGSNTMSGVYIQFLNLVMEINGSFRGRMDMILPHKYMSLES